MNKEFIGFIVIFCINVVLLMYLYILYHTNNNVKRNCDKFIYKYHINKIDKYFTDKNLKHLNFVNNLPTHKMIFILLCTRYSKSFYHIKEIFHYWAYVNLDNSFICRNIKLENCVVEKLFEYKNWFKYDDEYMLDLVNYIKEKNININELQLLNFELKDLAKYFEVE